MKNLGGWWRLWIVVSIIWVAAAGFSSSWDRPLPREVKDWGYGQPTLEEVNRTRQELCTPEDMAFLYDYFGKTDGLVMPTLAILNKNATPKSVAGLQCYARDGLRNVIRNNLALIMSLPALLLFAGLAFSWIRGGFRTKKSAEKAEDI
jgi:hypothetical protein